MEEEDNAAHEFNQHSANMMIAQSQELARGVNTVRKLLAAQPKQSGHSREIFRLKKEQLAHQGLRESAVAVIGSGALALQITEGLVCGGVGEIWPFDLTVDTDGVMSLVKPSNRKAIREMGEAASCRVKTGLPRLPDSPSFHCPNQNEQRSTEAVGLWVVCLSADLTQYAETLLGHLIKKSSNLLHVHCANDGLSGYVRQIATEEGVHPAYSGEARENQIVAPWSSTLNVLSGLSIESAFRTLLQVQGPEFAGYIKDTGKVHFTPEQTDGALEDQLKEVEVELEQVQSQFKEAVTDKQSAQQAYRDLVTETTPMVDTLEKVRINESAAMTLLMAELRNAPEETSQDPEVTTLLEGVTADRNTIISNAGKFIQNTDALKLYERSDKVADPVQVAFYHMLKTQSKLFEEQLDMVVNAAESQQEAYEEQLDTQRKRIVELEATMHLTSSSEPNTTK